METPVRRAFTLIEILVVVAIIALLASLLFGLVGWGNAFAVDTRNEALLQKVHAGLCDYQTIYESFPPTADDPLLGNRLAFFLCSAEEDIDRTERNSSVLLGEVAKSHIDGDDNILDAYEGGEVLLYAFTKPGTTEARSPVEMPAQLMSDDTDWATTAYQEYRQSFELWSAGPDGLAARQRSAEENADNLSVTAPFGELSTY